MWSKDRGKVWGKGGGRCGVREEGGVNLVV